MASGGSLKPSKCFSHVISFDWKADGRWCYSPNDKKPELNTNVPMPGGSLEPIEHLGVNVAKKTLGVYTCPSGLNKGSLDAMKEKAQECEERNAKPSKYLVPHKPSILAESTIWFGL